MLSGEFRKAQMGNKIFSNAVIYLFIFWSVQASFISAQPTVGLIQYNQSTESGYTLFSPTGSRNTYLIDQCGHEVHRWQTNFFPGQVAYLLPDGNLLRTGRLGGNFNTGGIGGRLEILSWEGTLVWHFDFASPLFQQHHVVLPMPDGNILILLYELKSFDEALSAGFKPEKIPAAGIWSEKIVEIKPKGNNDYDLIWEWNIWDHLIQDYDPDKSNFGDVRSHPELMDVNFKEEGAPNPSDWLHFNSLDYHPVLDQIMMSSRHHSEIYIIDHSTTTAEASGHIGGRYGRGGDFLYRFGNPAAYGVDSVGLRYLYGQHDAQWSTKSGVDDAIMVFDNGSLRPEGAYSRILEWLPWYNNDGSYTMTDGVYGIREIKREYLGQPPSMFFSPRLSGVQALENGHLLICEGNSGRIFEIDHNNDIIWEFVNPINSFGLIPQGLAPSGNDVFNCVRYRYDYDGFNGKQIKSADQAMVQTPASVACRMSTFTNEYAINKKDQAVSHTFINNMLEVSVSSAYSFDIVLFDASGIPVLQIQNCKDSCSKDLSNLTSGAYFLKVVCPGINKNYTSLIIKY